jgi:AAA15 family ATPase/GTPase
LRFLETAQTGVVGYRAKTEDAPLKGREFRSKFKAILSEFMEVPADELELADQSVTVQMAHRSKTGELVYLDLDDESEGTRRLLGLLCPAFEVLNEGGVMVVDELDASLHTHACELLLGLFASPTTNPKGAQLIATTHDTNLLASAHLRRDQVWFTEKDQEGATHLYPLTDFRTRKSDNLERGYLQGRFGAIPFAGKASELLSAF